MIELPPLPPGDEPTGEAELPLRYEDVTQDGRVALGAMMQGIGRSTWNTLAKHLPASKALRGAGVIPILRRLVLVGEDGPFSVHEPVSYEGTWRFARDEGGRIFCNMWMTARARHGTTFGPRPAGDAPLALVGRVFAEHVVTRPFAPPAERRVTSLEPYGLPLPAIVHPFLDAASLASGADLAEGEDVAFGLMHTDSNQHVNSLVYARVFEEIVARRAGAPAKEKTARAIELRWRKPFFAGDRARVRFAIEGDDVRGVFLPEHDDQPHAAVAMRLA